MRVPPRVSERIKEAPAQALRGVFAGIGQVLLITDKLRNKTPADAQVPRTRAPEPAEKHDAAPQAQAAAPPAAPQAPAAGHAPEARDLDKTGNVRLLDNDKAAPGAQAAGAQAAGAQAAGSPVAALPLPNYDALSIPSLRARLRNLNVAQLRQLLVYEQAHADRADVVSMFERRIAKLQADGADERAEAKAEAEIEAQEDVAAEVGDDVQAEAEGEA